MRESISSAHIHHQEEVHALHLPDTCSIGPASITWAGCVEGSQVACVVERLSPRCSGADRRSSQQRPDKYTQLGVFWCISRGLTCRGFACGCSCRRGAVSQVGRGSTENAVPTSVQSAARDLAGPLRPVVAWGQAIGPSRPITPIQCIGLRIAGVDIKRAPPC
jgi:hypothetical protein